MADRTTAQAAIDGLAAKQGQSNPVSPLTLANDDNTASIGTVVFNNNEGSDEYKIVRLADRRVVHNFDGSVHEQLLIP